jgi:hypothetical protein
MSISAKFGFIFAGLAAVLLGVGGASLMAGRAQQAESAAASEQLGAFTEVLVPLADDLRALQVDVIQVQQFFTDVAASHEAGGMAEAARYAEDFRSRLHRLRQLAGRLPPAAGRLLPDD